MKVTIDIDCSPEEARRFLGLPDLTPVHDVFVEKMKAAVGDGPNPEMFTEMMKSWGPMSEAGMAFWRQMMESARPR
jgi:3-methyladenine DNA glycosylase/8-oxoguanine DNA glycosylase